MSIVARRWVLAIPVFAAIAAAAPGLSAQQAIEQRPLAAPSAPEAPAVPDQPPPAADPADPLAAPEPEGPAPYVEELIEAERPSWRGVPEPIAHLRGLDKVAGRVSDLTVNVGETVAYGRLTISLGDCRRPPEGEGEDAFAFLKVRDTETGGLIFSGWMFASSPALSAMDDQRYDLWVLSCATS